MARIAEKRVDCIVTEFADIDFALQELLDAEDESFQYYDFRRGAFYRVHRA